MEKQIKFGEWDGNCPICGKEELYSFDVDYDLGIDGGVLERFECKHCGFSSVDIEYLVEPLFVSWIEPTSPGDQSNR